MTVRRSMRLAIAGLVTTTALAACGGPAAGGAAPTAAADPACAAFVPYGDLSSTGVSVLVPDDARAFARAAVPFETCTGATIVYEGGAGSVEPQLRARLAAGDPPDLAHVPGPGLLAALVEQAGPDAATAVPAPPPVTVNVEQYFPETYARAGSVGGTLYAAPIDAGITSWMRYSPRVFADRGLTVPATWGGLTALVDASVGDGERPWCPASEPMPPTTVLQDALLRDAGSDVYEGWVEHTIPFDDPRVVAALDDADALRDPDAVAGPGASLLDGTCLLEYPARGDLPADADLGPDGDVFAFPLPPADAGESTSVLVGGAFVVAFDARPEVAAFQAYLSSPEWVDAMARATAEPVGGTGGWNSAHAGLDPGLLADPLDRRTAEILQDPASVVRFDATELLPAAVGRGSFPGAMAAWAGGADAADVLGDVERSWPR